MMRLQYRNMSGRQTLVVNHTVDVADHHAGIRWYQLENTGRGWALHQQGTYSPNDNHRWMGSIAADKDGNLALGYSVSSSTVFPSIRYAGRLSTDPINTLGQAETELFPGTGSQLVSEDWYRNRWGDYSMMAVDPTDNCTFWYTQEYQANTGGIDWHTRVGSFRFPSCQPMVSLVGDQDNFHGGDAADMPPKSPFVQGVLNYIATDPGQHAAQGLDTALAGGFNTNRPVGFTHFFTLPPGARVTAATIELRAKGSAEVHNDVIVYDGSRLDPLNECKSPCVRKQYSPLVVLRDLLGHEPGQQEAMNLKINLAKVPVRIHTQLLPGDHWPVGIAEYRDLLGLLGDGQFNMIVGDDTMVDYSQLNITYVLPGAKPGDLNGDGRVDRNDLNMLYAVLNTKAYGPDDPRDLDHDGVIRLLDVNKLISLCTTQQPRCATQ